LTLWGSQVQSLHRAPSKNPDSIWVFSCQRGTQKAAHKDLFGARVPLVENFREGDARGTRGGRECRAEGDADLWPLDKASQARTDVCSMRKAHLVPPPSANAGGVRNAVEKNQTAPRVRAPGRLIGHVRPSSPRDRVGPRGRDTASLENLLKPFAAPLAVDGILAGAMIVANAVDVRDPWQLPQTY
jgi:hypothetical protein